MTGVYQEALDRRLPILAAWKAQIKIAREGYPLPEGWQDAVHTGVAELEALKRNRKLKIIGEQVQPLPVSNEDVETFRSQNPALTALIEKLSTMSGAMESTVNCESRKCCMGCSRRQLNVE